MGDRRVVRKNSSADVSGHVRDLDRPTRPVSPWRDVEAAFGQRAPEPLELEGRKDKALELLK